MPWMVSMKKIRTAQGMFILACVLLAGAGLSASSAQAAPPASQVTIEIGPQAGLRALVLVKVPVRISCPTGFDRVEASNGPLQQAAGSAIARTNVSAGLLAQPLVCDGTPHQNSFTAMADPAGPPFHAGEAAIRITLQLCNPDFECRAGDSGFSVIQLKPSS